MSIFKTFLGLVRETVFFVYFSRTCKFLGFLGLSKKRLINKTKTLDNEISFEVFLKYCVKMSYFIKNILLLRISLSLLQK